MLNWQDIQIPDIQTWKSIQRLWGSGQYAQAILEIEQYGHNGKWLDAVKFNDLLNRIVEVEELDDPTFANNRPITSDIEPQTPRNNQIWFEVIN